MKATLCDICGKVINGESRYITCTSKPAVENGDIYPSSLIWMRESCIQCALKIENMKPSKMRFDQ
jgi:hypothetical protein